MTSHLKSFCFFCSYIEKNRFHDAVGLYSIVSQRMFSVFLPHFDVIFLSITKQMHGIMESL